jgi:phage shock protein PspC (stress-responsive transcriptional regulator)
MGYRLYRSRRDRMLAGVAGGLAEMWGADPSLVRIIWALLVVFTGGVALLVYIVMAIVIPEEDEVFGPGGAPPRPTGTAPSTLQGGPAWGPRTSGGGLSPGVLLGGFFILIGAFLLAREFLPRIDFDWLGPLVLVALGAVLIVSALGRGPMRGGPSSPPPPSAPAPPADAPPPPPPPPTTEP